MAQSIELGDVGPVADPLQRAVLARPAAASRSRAARRAPARGRAARGRRRAARPARRRARPRPSARRSRCPAKASVYQASSSSPGRASSAPAPSPPVVATSRPQPWASSALPQLEKRRRERSGPRRPPGGAPAPTRIEPESRPSRRNGFGRCGRKPGPGPRVGRRRRGARRRCRPPRPRSRRGRPRTGSRSGRRASSSSAGSRPGSSPSSVRARAGPLHLDQQDVAGPQLARPRRRSRGRCPSGPRAGRRPRATAASGQMPSTPRVVVDAEQHPEHVGAVVAARRRRPPGARRRARRGAPRSWWVKRQSPSTSISRTPAPRAAGPLPGRAGADARRARRPR